MKNQQAAHPLSRRSNTAWIASIGALAAAWALHLPAQAKGLLPGVPTHGLGKPVHAPDPVPMPAPIAAPVPAPAPAPAERPPAITPSLKKLLSNLPIDEAKGQVQDMVAALKKTSCGAQFSGCYATQSGPLQLYFFTSGQAQQTLLLVVDKDMPIPKLLGDSVQKLMGSTSLSSPILSLSTTDFELDNAKMPPALQKVVRERYFNVNTLAFSSGVQVAARANLGGPIKLGMESLGVQANQLTMRAAVVMPIPTDLAGSAGAAAGVANAVQHGDTMAKAGADAMSPEAFVEFQFAPNAVISMTSPSMNLTDATFFLNNALTFGFKGNGVYRGVPNKKILIQFQTPLNPAGAMDLLDFEFRMATPQSFTMEDAANMMVAMATPDPRLAKYGGGFIRNIASFKQPLLAAAKPLSVFKLQNPVPAPEYKFGDSNKPWPNDPKYFNIAVLGPLAQGGPLMKAAGDVNILGQKMGWLDASAGTSGLYGSVGEALSLKMGPLGKVNLRMEAMTAVNKDRQDISLKGNLAGQKVAVTLSGTSMKVEVSASCVNPFEINVQADITPSTDIAQVFEGQGGVNVDPSKIGGCIGKELEAAYKKISGEFSHLGGYTANAANAELKKISDAAAAEVKRAEEAARKQYEDAKNAARNVANQSSNAANNALKAADNVFKGFGKKKRHKPGPDPKFASTVFDWDYYYDNAPDVVRQGMDLATHWRDAGFAEGRQGSPEFNANFYYARYTDVQQACPGNLQCALQHWLDWGINQGRQGSAQFSVASYVSRYPDLMGAYTNGDFAGAFEHWYSNGITEGRSGSPTPAYTGQLPGAKVAGGGGGGSWDDFSQCAGQYVNGFRLRAGGSVDTIQFSYAGRGWANSHGYQNSSPFPVEVVLPDGEYFVKVDFGAGGRVDNLIFKTNRGRSFGRYGGGGTNGSFTVRPGEKLGCMAGRAGSSIDQLRFNSTGPR